MNIFDFFTAINLKQDSLKEDPQSITFYMINQLLSQYSDSLLHVNEMNSRPSCDDKLQYEYLFHSLRQGDRNIQRWMVPDTFNQNNLELVKQYCGYSTEKAQSALEILTDEQLDYVERERKSNIDINEKRRLLRTKQSNEMNRLIRQR